MKKNKPAEEPILTEPELRTTAPEASTYEPPSEPTHDMPTPNTDPLAYRAADGSENPEVPNSVRMDDPQDRDVEITKTGFAEPGG